MVHSETIWSSESSLGRGPVVREVETLQDGLAGSHRRSVGLTNTTVSGPHLVETDVVGTHGFSSDETPVTLPVWALCD